MTHGESARRCVLIPSGTFKLIIEAGKTRPHNGGWAGSFLLVQVIGDHGRPSCSAACITSRTNSSSPTTTVTFSMTPAVLRMEAKTS